MQNMLVLLLVEQLSVHQTLMLWYSALPIFGHWNVKSSGSSNEKCEQFVCSLYTKSLKAGTTCDSVRYWLFCQRKQRNESLCPTSDSLSQHIKRANFQTMVWRRALLAKQDIPDPVGHGWEDEDETLVHQMMTKDPAPISLPELVTCHCVKSACRRKGCICLINGLPCTEACYCLSEDCENPRNHYDNGSSDDELED